MESKYFSEDCTTSTVIFGVIPPALPIKEAVACISRIDLEMIKMKLLDPEEGPGWEFDTVNKVESEYRSYLTMTLMYPEYSLVPTKRIDQFWHQHILDTQKYADDCQRIFGKFLHHFPYFGMRGEEDKKNLESSFLNTSQLYESLFDEPYVSEKSGAIQSCGSGACAKCGSEHCSSITQ